MDRRPPRPLVHPQVLSLSPSRHNNRANLQRISVTNTEAPRTKLQVPNKFQDTISNIYPSWSLREVSTDDATLFDTLELKFCSLIGYCLPAVFLAGCLVIGIFHSY